MKRPEPLYRARIVIKGKVEHGEPTTMLSAATADCWKAVNERGATFAAIDKNQQGADHPDNAGKYFLYQFIKA